MFFTPYFGGCKYTNKFLFINKIIVFQHFDLLITILHPDAALKNPTSLPSHPIISDYASAASLELYPNSGILGSNGGPACRFWRLFGERGYRFRAKTGTTAQKSLQSVFKMRCFYVSLLPTSYISREMWRTEEEQEREKDNML